MGFDGLGVTNPGVKEDDLSVSQHLAQMKETDVLND